MPTGNFVAVVVKRLHVVEAFGGQTEVSLADLAAGNHVVKSSVYRILYTLNQLGYVEKLPAGCYSLTARWNHLAGAAQPPENLIAVASPLMTKLLAQFHETVNLGILHGPEVLYIHVLENPHRLRLSAHAGMRSPIHSTALGKCLLSSRSEVEVKVILKQRPSSPWLK